MGSPDGSAHPASGNAFPDAYERRSRRLGHVHGRLKGALLAADAPSARAIGEATPDYPAGLRDLRDAPSHVYVRGAAVPRLERCVAIVGSRAASAYGLAVAERLALDLASLGLTIVSGFARGIDAAAHRGALAGGGGTVAVVPSGLDRVSPLEHGGLGEAILERGTLLSEIASGPPFGKGAFVRRNRLVAALGFATIVVEAAERSGALSTAAYARALGRVLLAVPGDIDRPSARGTLALLRGGARLCASAADVLAVAPAGTGAAAATPLDRVRAALDARARSAEQIAVAARVSVAEALALLLRLEWTGVALAAPGQRWRRGGGDEA